MKRIMKWFCISEEDRDRPAQLAAWAAAVAMRERRQA